VLKGRVKIVHLRFVEIFTVFVTPKCFLFPLPYPAVWEQVWTIKVYFSERKTGNGNNDFYLGNSVGRKGFILFEQYMVI